MAKNSRILNQQIDLNKASLLKFFEERGVKYDKQDPYVSVLYQDQNKALAASRDAYEKHKILPLLRLDGQQRLLDIGCGIGRWADATLSNLKFYLGVDFSAKLIECARERFHDMDHAQFLVMDAKDVSYASLGEYGVFDRIIISGVLLYMNDKEVEQVLRGVIELCAPDCVIYVREPLACTERLTLDEYWSLELNSCYSAIYRTKEEMDALMGDVFGASGFKFKRFTDLYDNEEMNNRSETRQFYTLFSKGD